MTEPSTDIWVEAVRETVASYRRTIDAAVEQLTDAELRARPAAGFHSVAVVLRHLGGNLRSRWTDFLDSDGEKPDRSRDAEFQDWEGDRESLLAYFHEGWTCLEMAVEQLSEQNVSTPVFIRGEEHSIPQALLRSMTHIAYHVGQIVMIARTVHAGEWKWLTIPPGESEQHNRRTWGTAASRSSFGAEP